MSWTKAHSFIAIAPDSVIVHPDFVWEDCLYMFLQDLGIKRMFQCALFGDFCVLFPGAPERTVLVKNKSRNMNMSNYYSTSSVKIF